MAQNLGHRPNLEELLQYHPHWPHLQKMLDEGATFPLSSISDEDRLMDL
jgi:hypothetical protein